MKLRAVARMAGYCALACMPNSVKCYIYNYFLGCEIHPTARIGFSYVQAKKIIMGPYARIGHFNVIRNLEKFELGAKSSILHLNRANSIPLGTGKHFHDNQTRFPALIMGEHSSITGKHHFDCNDTIRIGDYATIAGMGSLFLTHGINIEKNRQEAAPLNIGKYTMIGAQCVLVKGAVLPDFSVLAANSTLHKIYNAAYMLYSGVPAVPVYDT